MTWSREDVAQLTYLRAQNSTVDEIAAALSRSRHQVRAKIGQMIRRNTLARKFRAVRIAAGRGAAFAHAIGISPERLPDYRMLRDKGYGAAEAVETIRRWVA